jgi:segregation and condensation protein B
MNNLKNIIEALLFTAHSPLSAEMIQNIVMGQADTKEIKDAAGVLAAEYESRNGAFRLHEVAGGWQIRTLSEHAAWIRRMLQPGAFRMSRAALETLAAVAYRQPVMRSDVEHVRGVDCGGVLRALLEKKLVRILGRREIPGRPLIYGTTKKFLEVFGLKNLKDLPSPSEFRELAEETAENIDAPPAEAPRTATESAGEQTDDKTA